MGGQQDVIWNKKIFSIKYIVNKTYMANELTIFIFYSLSVLAAFTAVFTSSFKGSQEFHFIGTLESARGTLYAVNLPLFVILGVDKLVFCDLAFPFISLTH